VVLDRWGILKNPGGLNFSPELGPRAVLSIFLVQKKSTLYEKYF